MPEKLVVRGYDSDELFREDLWLIRIHESRKESPALAASMGRLNESVGGGDEYLNRVCIMLAEHAGAKFDH